MNAVEIEAALSELALQPFDGSDFPFAFLAAFGNKPTTLKRLRSGNNNTSDLPGGVLQRNNIHLAVCEAGRVAETLKALHASPTTVKAKAKFILATDGETLEAEELAGGETIACAYPDFPDHFGFFLPLAGISTIKEIKENPVDVRATGRLNKLYVELLRENPEWATDDRRPDMNHFMARLVFCFFAEDTDIFNGEGLFTQTIEQMSERDGSNTHHVLAEIFRAMNIESRERTGVQPRLPNWADGFPYVNGGLFSGSAEVPRFTRMARSYLIHAGSLNWREINPDIFGSMIQAVADDEERGALGMHYTSVPNILKVLNPLFLDELRAKLEEAGDNPRKLLNFPVFQHPRLEHLPRPPPHRAEQAGSDPLRREHPARPRGPLPGHHCRTLRPGEDARQPARRPRAQRRGAGAHLHRPPLQERHRAAGKAVRALHQDDGGETAGQKGEKTSVRWSAFLRFGGF